MSTKRKGRPAEPAVPSQAADKPIELVVRRGALWRFNTLKKKTADLPVTVMWDRRQGERRAASGGRTEERRGADRRQQPPFTWEVADFVVVGPASAALPETASGPKRTRKKKS